MSRVLESLPLDQIRTDGGTQPRAFLDPATVQNYAEAMSRGDQFPPLIVFHDGTTYWLADGFHRLQAAKDSTTPPDPDIDCEIKQGTQRDAVLYSAGVNATHGLPRSNADKRRVVARMLTDDEWRTWSDRKIAAICHVSHPFVGTLRRELFGDDVSDVRKAVRDGKEYEVASGNISRSNVERGEKEYETGAPESDSPDRSDLEDKILGILADGEKTVFHISQRLKDDSPTILDLRARLGNMAEDGTISRSGGTLGKPLVYHTNVVKESNGGNGAPSLDLLRDQIVGWLNEQNTSQRPFWPGEIRKGANIDRKHESLFGQALDQLVGKGVLQRFANGQYHFAEFAIKLPARIAHLPAEIRVFTPPGETFRITDLNNYANGPLQVAASDLKKALDYMVEQGELTCSGPPLYYYARPEIAAPPSESSDTQVDHIDPDTGEVTPIALTPEREPDPDRPVDPVHTRHPLVASDEWGYLDQRPIRVVSNAIASLEALEGALDALDGTEFTLALAHNPQYPTARRVKQADEVALRVCAQIARLDVLCAQFATQQAAQKAEATQPEEDKSDALHFPGGTRQDLDEWVDTELKKASESTSDTTPEETEAETAD